MPRAARSRPDIPAVAGMTGYFDLTDLAASDLDRIAAFTIPDRHARGRVARLGPTLDAILHAHAYPPAIEQLLAESLTLTALLGATLKDAKGQLTLQAQIRGGIVSLMVCDYQDGRLRGYVQFDAERLSEAPEIPSLYALFGTGHLAITFDLAQTGERYQGVVALDGATIAEAAENYFDQSEQIPSLIRLGSHRDADGRLIAGGLFLQHMPEGEEGRERLHTRDHHPEWEHVEALGATLGADELADPALSLETIIWRLFNEEREVRVQGAVAISKGCRCDADYIRQVLAKFPVEERREMAEADGLIHVDCAFCARKFPVPADSADA